jgi:2-dehydro-3-deoxygalactonokinase
MTATHRPLIAVDWGTSSLRGALLDAQGRLQQQHASAQGILAVPAGQFATVFEATFGVMLAQMKILAPENSGLVLISGMAGSQQGWVQAPYCPCPAGFGELAQQLAWIVPPGGHQGTPPMAVVPGLSCEHEGMPDVMRGEEVQVFGALRLLGLRDASVVLPGTHSKWVNVQDEHITDFRTYMTGEIFALLRQQSILARTLPPLQDGVATDELDPDAFDDGVATALRSSSLLNTAFSTRSLSLFGRRTPPALASYLSGLVIGEELRAQQPRADQDVIVIGSGALTERYSRALLQCGIRSQTIGPQATWQGLWAIASALHQGTTAP